MMSGKRIFISGIVLFGLSIAAILVNLFRIYGINLDATGSNLKQADALLSQVNTIIHICFVALGVSIIVTIIGSVMLYRDERHRPSVAKASKTS